jgi:hypothetical protein
MSAPVLQELLAAIERSYGAATGQWDGAPWTHEFTEDAGRPDRVGRARLDARGELLYCEGEREDCYTCRMAAEDASVAEDCATQALAAARAGDWREARRAAVEAAEHERSWGDAPTWGAFEKAVEAAEEAGQVLRAADEHAHVVETISRVALECEEAARAEGWDGVDFELAEGDCDAIVEAVEGAIGRKPTRQEWADAGWKHVGGKHRAELAEGEGGER